MRERVVAAMSGGVDSAVAAALLVEQGHEVIGITMRVVPCAEDGSEAPTTIASQRCCTALDVNDAKLAAAQLGIPHYVLNVKEAFQRDVLDPFLDAYKTGRTPIPCAPCNHAVKFGALLAHAEGLGAAAVATGHYARIVDGDRLFRATDPDRDQTYFLHGLTRSQLRRTRFPLGAMTKPAARAMAKARGIAVADKPDSQEICFIPDGDTAGFLARRLGDTPGRIVDSGGRDLGAHRGIHLFTIGQRKGLGLTSTTPLHVVALEPESNTVVVGPEEELYAPGCEVEGLNLLPDAWPQDGIEVKIRSRHAGARAAVEPCGPGRVRVTFVDPQRSVTPGQAAVFYAGDEVLGGGTIARTHLPIRELTPVASVH